MRELFPEAQNSLRQGAEWLKFGGCVLALMLLATSAIANPQLDLTNPAGFFTNVAMAMFKQMDLHDFNGNLVTVTNIPLYEDPAQFGGTNVNYYTPAVHRILQLAANIFDATTNRFIDGGPTNYPTVFRPVFMSQGGVLSIVSYVEVTNSADAFLPFIEASNFVAEAPQNIPNPFWNIYGVPWVIGAKKGFPNFNEMSMVNQLQVTRKLQFTNVQGRASLPWQTNQIFEFAISNAFGAEVWNSYASAYGRPLQLFITNELFLQLTNETGVTFLSVNDLGFGSNIFYNTGWPGCNFANAYGGAPDPSFQVPLLASATFTNAIYNQDGTITPLTPPLFSVSFAPRFWMGLHYRFHYALIDTSVNRVIDFVNLVGPPPNLQVVDVISNLSAGETLIRDSSANNFADIWETNLVNGGVVLGVLNLIDANLGQPVGTFLPGMTTGTTGTIAQFQRNLWGDGTASSFQTEDSAVGYINELLSWSANDPLVHYTAPDLTAPPSNSPGSSQLPYNQSPPQTDADGAVLKTPPAGGYLPNLGRLNTSYQPWGGYPMNPDSPNFDLNYQVKDPLIFRPDDWDFPIGESLTFDWLGQVHRGTPWQTVFLKPSNQTVALWSAWNNDNILITNGNVIYIDAAFTLPTNDWRIASLWAQWLNTNDLSTLLSVNNTDPNAWTARLDGLTALTNSAPGELDPITITSNSPQAGVIAQAIQTARANTNPANGPVFPNQLFQQVGDVLATPQLTVASPFVNANGLSSGTANGITDEALEIIPSQLLPLLRVDSFGQIASTNGQLELSFSGYDGYTYAIEASSNLTDWVIISTNCPTDGSFGITNTAASGQQFYRSVLLH